MTFQPDSKNLRNLFSNEQNYFLLSLISQKDSSTNDKISWKNIVNIFNSQFPNSRKTTKAIQMHYNNVLNPNLNRTPISGSEEDSLIHYLHEYGNKFRNIAKLMNRTENSVKNHFNAYLTKILPPKEIQKIKIIGLIDEDEKLQHFNTIKNCGSNQDIHEASEFSQILTNDQSQKNEQQQENQICPSCPTISSVKINQITPPKRNVTQIRIFKKSQKLEPFLIPKNKSESDASQLQNGNENLSSPITSPDFVDDLHIKASQRSSPMITLSSLDDYELQRNRWFSHSKPSGFWEN
jgi:hypothetical protein